MDDLSPVYVKTDELAQLLDLTARRVQQLAQDGVIGMVSVGGDADSGPHRRYDLIPTLVAYIKHLQNRVYRRKDAADREDQLKEQKLKAEIALKESQGELHRLKTSIAAGEYISREEIRMDYGRFFVEFKRMAGSLPARACASLSGQLDPVELRRIEKEMGREINALLDSFVSAAVEDSK